MGQSEMGADVPENFKSAKFFAACKEDFHLDLQPDLLASGALHLLGGKAAVNMHTLLSQLLRFDILVTRII